MVLVAPVVVLVKMNTPRTALYVTAGPAVKPAAIKVAALVKLVAAARLIVALVSAVPFIEIVSVPLSA